jgi:hypothetical protein
MYPTVVELGTLQCPAGEELTLADNQMRMNYVPDGTALWRNWLSTGAAMPDRSPLQRKWRTMHSCLREHQTGYVSTQPHRHLMPPSALHPKTAHMQRYFLLGPIVAGPHRSWRSTRSTNSHVTVT